MPQRLSHLQDGDVALPGRRAQRAPADERTLEDAQDRALAETREARRRQAELVALRRNMLSAFGHEMRTPLTVVLGFADLLLDGIDRPLTDGQHEAVTAIREAALQELHLLDDALALARARTDSTQLDRTRVDLVELVAEAAAVVRDAARAKGLDVECEPAGGPIWLHADRGQLRRAVDHLLANAVKFTEHGSVTVRCSVHRSTAVLDVHDTGIGIAGDDVAAIFDDFRQLEQGPTRRFGGAGLGLALVRTLVEAHGGRVRVVSTPGDGSRFTVTLPMAGAGAS